MADALINDRIFPNIVDWMKNKVNANPEHIKILISPENYTRLKTRVASRKTNLTEVEFADVLLGELEVIKLTSGAEANIADAIIKSIRNRYEIEKKDFHTRKNFIEEISSKVEIWFRNIDLDFDEFILGLITGYNVTRAFLNTHDSFLTEMYAEFKHAVFRKYLEYEGKVVFDEDFISTILIEREKISAKIVEKFNYFLIQEFKSNLVNLHPIKIKYSELQREAENKHCTVCFVEYIDTSIIIMLRCCHSFHESCINEWFKKKSTCPTCCR